MKVAIGFDHAGFILRDTITKSLAHLGVEVIDFGTDTPDPVDFPDFAADVGQALQRGEAQRGILVCGSGVGACIAANKMKGVYASVCHDTYSAAQGVAHDNMNVLCIGSRVVGGELAAAIVRAFMGARYIGGDSGGERFARRVDKIRRLEERGEL